MKNLIQQLQSPLSFKLYLLANLPMAFLAGLKISELNEEKCTVTIPYKYLTKNPFRSIYFACLSMAAEMSTGVLAMLKVHNSSPPVSMLVVGMEANFLKKCTGKISFICNDGKKISEVVEQSKITGEGKTITSLSEGFNSNSEKVAEFRVTWSFKPKNI